MTEGPTQKGWDGVSDLYEDDEPLADVLAITKREPNVITQAPPFCAICILPNDESGHCTRDPSHTAKEQVRVRRARQELTRDKRHR